MNDLADLLERFRRGGELITVVTTGARGGELDWSPGLGKWSVRQIVFHVVDSELVGACRFRSVIAEDNPVLTRYDQDAWAARLNYAKHKLSQAIETFRRIRSENHDLLKDLSEETYQRIGTHSERGPLTLLDLLRTYAQHAENHARQIQAVRQEYKRSKAK